MRDCRRGACAAFVAAVLCACGQGGGRSPALPPGQQTSGQDAGPVADGGPADAGPPDAGPSDSGPAADKPNVPVLLASGEHGPLTLAADDENVLYWGTTEEGTGAVIRATQPTGGGPVTLLALPRRLDLPGGVHHHARIDRLEVDASWMFFSTTEWEWVPNPDDVASIYYAGGFYRAPKSGGSAEIFAIPEGFGAMAPFSPDDDAIYFYAPGTSGIAIAAVPKSGGAVTTFRLEAPAGNLATVNSIAMDARYWYVSRSNYFGAAHTECVSRAPRSGGVLEDVWCPNFLVQHLVLAGSLLVGVDPWPSTAAPGTWGVDLATASANPIALADKQIVGLAADASRGALYAVEISLGSEVPPVPATSDLVRIEVASGRRTVVDHDEGSAPAGRCVVVGAGSIFFTRGGDVLRIDP